MFAALDSETRRGAAFDGNPGRPRAACAPLRSETWHRHRSRLL